MADRSHWPAAEAACRAWTRTRERPHPPMPEVVRYLVKAGERMWLSDGAICRLTKDTIVDWPPTEPGAEWNAMYSRWERGGSVAYHVVPTDLALYEHLYNLGLLSWPAGETIDRRKAPGA